MRINFGKLVAGTEFKHLGKKYKKTSKCWNTTEYLSVHQYGDHNIPSKSCSSVIPFLGGQYQTQMEYWIPDDEDVEVD